MAINNVVNKIMRPYCMKVLPLVYDDSLSYYEAVCKLVTKINEVIDALDTIGEGILDEAKAYTDSKIAETFEEVDKKIEEINNLIDELNESYATFTETIQDDFIELTRTLNEQIELINNIVQNLDDKFTSEIKASNDRTALLIQQNNEYLLEEMGKNLSKIKVVNFFTGEEVTIQSMFDYLAMLHIDDSITYTQMANRAKTYTQLVTLNINYTNLVLHGNTLYV